VIDQVIEQHAEASTGTGPEGTDDLGQVIGPVEWFDHDPLDAQIVPPHPLDQFGIVSPFHQDAAGAGDAGRGVGHRHRSRGGTAGRRRGRGRRHEGDLSSLDHEATVE